MSSLPDYVVIKDPYSPDKEVLLTPAQPFSFPLSDPDLTIIKTLEAKFDAEENCAGLAAPQLGFSKQGIIFAAPYSPELKKWRPDLIDTMPKTVWLNARYQPFGTEQSIDYEGCFSVGGFAGPVARYKTIDYEAFLIDGSRVTGRVQGFLARLIQHEIDHTHGILFSSLVPKGQLLPLDHYRRLRAEAMEKGRSD